MGCSVVKGKIHDEGTLVKKTANHGSWSARPKTLRTDSQEIWFSDKSMLNHTSSANFYTLAGTFNEKVKALKGSEIAFHFDISKMQFICYDFAKKKWTTNDLTQARTLNVTNSLDEGFDLERDLISRLDCYTLLAIDENKIEIVGPSHFQYHISLNTFSTRPSMSTKALKAPCLAFSGRRLFAISGEQHNNYTPSAEVYDMNSKSWTRLEELSQPHGKGLSCCFLSDRKLLKVLVAGGYCSKNPLTPSTDISIYDDHSKRWLTYEFSKTDIPLLPAFTEGAIYISEGGMVNIQLTKGTADNYELNLAKGQLAKVRSMNRVAESHELEILRVTSSIDGDLGFLFGAKDSVSSGIKLSSFKKAAAEYYTSTTSPSLHKWSQLVPLPKKMLVSTKSILM